MFLNEVAIYPDIEVRIIRSVNLFIIEICMNIVSHTFVEEEEFIYPSQPNNISIKFFLLEIRNLCEHYKYQTLGYIDAGLRDCPQRVYSISISRKT